MVVTLENGVRSGGDRSEDELLKRNPLSLREVLD
jgi:hypothetical protein